MLQCYRSQCSDAVRFLQDFRGSLSLTFCFIKIKAMEVQNALNGKKKVLIVISRDLKFGEKKIRRLLFH